MYLPFVLGSVGVGGDLTLLLWFGLSFTRQWHAGVPESANLRKKG